MQRYCLIWSETGYGADVWIYGLKHVVAYRRLNYGAIGDSCELHGMPGGRIMSEIRNVIPRYYIIKQRKSFMDSHT